MKKNNKKVTPKRKKEREITFPAKVLSPVRHFLINEEKKLLQKMKLLKTEDPFNNESRVNDNASPDTDAREQMDHIKNKAIEQAMRRKLIQIRKALARIKIGKYGVCERCGRMIDTERLMIYPETTLCIHCERKKSK